MFGILFWFCVLLIVYVYAGYPFLIAFFAHLRPERRFPPFTNLPSVTLLIAAYNEERVIAAKLENCLALDYPPERLQILIAADGSNDRTMEIVESYAGRGVELSYSPERRGKLAAINRAMQMARNEIVVFSDANNSYATDTLRTLVAPFADERVGCTAGSKNIIAAGSRLGEADSLYWRYESFIKKQETRLTGCCIGVSGEIYAIRRELYRPLPDKVINDDFFVALSIIQQGYNVIYVPEAVSCETTSASEQDEIIRRTRIVAGRYQAMIFSLRKLPWRRPLIVWQILSHKFMRPLVPFAMLGALAGNLGAVALPSTGRLPAWLSLALPYGWVFLGLQAGFYLLALLGKRLRMSGLFGKLLYIPTFLVNSNYAALLGLFRYLTGRQTALWEKAARLE
jgi:biofilm PGA synthesis N-glycosyltransferase PgaC